MVLDSRSLTVEFVVDHPGKLGVGAVEPALNGRANRSRTLLLRRALSQTKKVALREHGGCGLTGRRWTSSAFEQTVGLYGRRAFRLTRFSGPVIRCRC